MSAAAPAAWGGRKLILAVIDGVAPEMLERAMAAGQAPTLQRIANEGTYVGAMIAAFPSVTPVCTASIVTGAGPDEHNVPAMCWYHRGEARYVDYGSSFQASRTFGIQRSLTDTIYNLNLAHLSQATPTVFELLDDAGLRTAGTTFLMYRGRHRHEAAGESGLARLVTSTLFRHAVYGPREFFYADLFASRETGCRSQLGLPGVRDEHAGCVSAYLAAHDLFDFLLLSLPDNDAASHKSGPDAQVGAIAAADAQLARVMDAAGGVDAYLADHAVMVVSDHAQVPVQARSPLLDALGPEGVLQPNDPRPDDARIAVCPSQRSAMVYALRDEDRDARFARRIAGRLDDVPGIDLAMWLDGEEAAVRGGGRELRFAPGGDVVDAGGVAWSVEGEPVVLDAEVRDGRIGSEAYPDALGRIWSALTCAAAGEVLVSATPGHEFVDWGGIDHLGGGSHGALHRADANGIFLAAGIDGLAPRAQWTLRDVLPLVRRHFGLD